MPCLFARCPPSTSCGHYLSVAKLTAAHRYHALTRRSYGQLRTYSSSTSDRSDGSDGSSSSSSSDEDSSDSDTEQPKKVPVGGNLKPDAETRQASADSNKTSDLIAKLQKQDKAEKDAIDLMKEKDKGHFKTAEPNKKQSKKNLNLAKPGKLKRELREKRLKDVESKKDLENDKAMELEPGMTSAIKGVAKDLGGDGTASDLLIKLKEQQKLSEEQSKSKGVDLNDLFSGITVKKGRQRQERLRGRGRNELGATKESGSLSPTGEQDPADPASRKPREGFRRPSEKLPALFGEDRLGVFDAEESKAVAVKPSLFDAIQKEELEKYAQLPPANAFEEQIQWKKKGMVWDFPVNNEVGMEHEENVGFHEHVFLEHLLADGFPTKGPVRHFMELVCVGLSKNPYLTVQQKHEHIDWFRDYFKSKQKIMEEMMVTEDSTAQKQIQS